MKTKTKTKSIKNLYSKLCKCNKEEEVKAEYCKYFGMKLNAVGNIDHYHPNVLFEFKYDKVMSKAEVRATVVAQAVYYVHDLMYGKSTLAIPPAIGVVDKNEGFYVKTSEVADLASGEYEWQRPASSPDGKLVAAVQKALGDTVTLYSFSDAEACAAYEECTRSHLEGNGEPVKKKITCSNLLDVYERWQELFGEYVTDDVPAREYFKVDMVEGKAGLSRDGKFIEFDLPGGTRKKQLIISDYENFWRVYEKLNQAEAVKVMTKADLLLSIQKRRFNGDFYTPVEFAELACGKVEGLLGKWWESGEYRLWDMAAGTGNLELPLPAEALKYCYMSTLDKADADYLDLTFGRAGATCFQYDFLNDDVTDDSIGTDKLPENLQKDLANTDIKWIVLINPPYASDGESSTGNKGKEKAKVAYTNVRKLMQSDGWGKASKELYAQFIYRVQRQFAGKDTHLCMLSTTKYVWGVSHSKLREKFTGILRDGFFMPSMAFGLKGKFPILFACWQLGGKYSNNSDTAVAVYGENCKIIGHKQVTGVLKRDVINEWIKQEGQRTEPDVPFTSALSVVTSTKQIAPQEAVVLGHLFTYVNKCNDIQHQSGQFLMSSTYADKGCAQISVTKAVSDKAIVQFAVFQAPERTWLSEADMFTVPHTDPMTDTEFVNDCWAYALFANQNFTTAQKDVEYKGKKYQIRNELFPFMPTKVQAWKCSHTDIATQLAFKPQASFAAKRMDGQVLSSEAQAVMDAGEEVYKFFYENLHNTRWKEANIDYWDAGWIQVKTACKTLTGDLLKEYKKLDKKLLEARQALRAKLLEKVYSYGFKCKDIEPLS